MLLGQQAVEIDEAGILSQIDNRLTRLDSCGPVSLWYCLKWYGRPEHVHDLINGIPKVPGGVQIEKLAEVSNQRGLPCNIVKHLSSDIATLPVPSILVINDKHCVVYLGVDRKTDDYLIFEPLNGRQGTEQRSNLEAAATGIALVFSPLPSTFHAMEYGAIGSLFLLLLGICHVAFPRSVKGPADLKEAT